MFSGDHPVFKLVAIGIAGCVLAATLIVAAVKNPYLRPRAEKPENTITAQAQPAPKVPAIVVAEAKISAMDRAAMPAVTATRKQPTSTAPPEPQARPSAPDGFSAYAGTMDANKREAPSAKPPLAPPLPVPAPKTAEKTNPNQNAADHLVVASLPLPPPAQVAARVRQQALTAERKAAEPPPPRKKTQKQNPRAQAKQFPPPAAQKQERSGYANAIRVVSPRENARFETLSPGSRAGVLRAQSSPTVRVIYGTHSSAEIVDGPVIIRLR